MCRDIGWEATLGGSAPLCSPGHKALKNSLPASPRTSKGKAVGVGEGSLANRMRCTRHTTCHIHTHNLATLYLSSWWTNLAGVSARAEGGKECPRTCPPRAPFPKAQTSEGVMDKGGAGRSPLKSSWPGATVLSKWWWGQRGKGWGCHRTGEKAAERGQRTQRPRGQKPCTGTRCQSTSNPDGFG